MKHELATLFLKKNEDRRLNAGHLWIFSNEVDTQKTSLGSFTPGEIVEVQAVNGRFIGYAYVNPHSLICARLLSRRRKNLPGPALIQDRILAALSLRQSLYAKPYYRLLYGESDQLPGLVVDRYGDVLVIQVTTLGMEMMLDGVIELLDELLKPSAILLRNDSTIREMEGLELYSKIVKGDPGEHTILEENGVRFQAPLSGGQKTGWFYDHRDNRARLRRYVQDKKVLDVFSYIGGWGVQAACFGAREVVCVDASKSALEQAQHNAGLNGVQESVSSIRGDAFDVLKQLRDEGKTFDVVILDPPAFIKRKKDHKKGLEAYQRLNELAMRLLPAGGGMLVSASCSFHLSAEDLRRVLLRASRQLDVNLVILEQGGQGPDHPVHPAIPETEYLKSFFCYVSH